MAPNICSIFSDIIKGKTDDLKEPKTKTSKSSDRKNADTNYNQHEEKRSKGSTSDLKNILRKIRKSNPDLSLVLTSSDAYGKGMTNCDTCRITKVDYKKIMEGIRVVSSVVDGVIEKAQEEQLEKCNNDDSIDRYDRDLYRPGRGETIDNSGTEPKDPSEVGNSPDVNHSLQCVLIKLQKVIGDVMMQVCFLKSTPPENLDRYKQFDIELDVLRLFKLEYNNLTDKIIVLFKDPVQNTSSTPDVCVMCLKGRLFSLTNAMADIVTSGKKLKLVMKNETGDGRESQCCYRTYPHIHAEAQGRPIVLTYSLPLTTRNIGNRFTTPTTPGRRDSHGNDVESDSLAPNTDLQSGPSIHGQNGEDAFDNENVPAIQSQIQSQSKIPEPSEKKSETNSLNKNGLRITFSSVDIYKSTDSENEENKSPDLTERKCQNGKCKIQGNVNSNTSIHQGSVKINPSKHQGSVKINPSKHQGSVKINPSKHQGSVKSNHSIPRDSIKINLSKHQVSVKSNLSIYQGSVKSNNALQKQSVKSNRSVHQGSLQSINSKQKKDVNSNHSIHQGSVKSISSRNMPSVKSKHSINQIKSNHSKPQDTVKVNSSKHEGTVKSSTLKQKLSDQSNPLIDPNYSRGNEIVNFLTESQRLDRLKVDQPEIRIVRVNLDPTKSIGSYSIPALRRQTTVSLFGSKVGEGTLYVDPGESVLPRKQNKYVIKENPNQTKEVKHHNKKVEMILNSLGKENLLLVSSPANCIRENTLHSRNTGESNLPLSVSLYSLPLDINDLKYIAKEIGRCVSLRMEQGEDIPTEEYN